MQESGSPVVSSALTTIVKLHCNTSCPSLAPAALRPRKEDAWLKRLMTGSFDAEGSFPCGNRGTKFCCNTITNFTALIKNKAWIFLILLRNRRRSSSTQTRSTSLKFTLKWKWNWHRKLKVRKFGDYLEERNFEVSNIVPDDVVCSCNMSAGLHVVGTETGLIWEVRVQCNMSPQVHQINQKFLPRCLQKRHIHR